MSDGPSPTAALSALEQALCDRNQRSQETRAQLVQALQENTGKTIQQSQEAGKRWLQNMRKFMPWVDADVRAQHAISLAMLPRTVAGQYQGDYLMRTILYAIDPRPFLSLFTEKLRGPISPDLILSRLLKKGRVREQCLVWSNKFLVFDKITRATNPNFVGRNCTNLNATDEKIVFHHPVRVTWAALEIRPASGWNASTLFQDIAERLKHLETYQPSLGDHAVEAMQDAFVGYLQDKCDWGRKGYPTKGKVTAMAKQRLAQQGKEKRRGWTDHLRAAGLEWLPEGRAGRPSDAALDEHEAAVRKAKTVFAQILKTGEVDVQALVSKLRALHGSKSEYQRQEKARQKVMPETDPEE